MKVYFIRFFPLLSRVLFAATTLFFVPWDTFDSFEYPKFIVSLFLIPFLLFLLLCSQETFHFEKIPKEIRFFFILLCIGELIAFTFSTDHAVSFIGAIYRYQGFASQIFFLVWFLCSFFYFSNQRNNFEKKIFLSIPIFCSISCVLALISLTHPISFLDPSNFENRVFSSFGNPNYLASFVILSFPFLFLIQKRSIRYSGVVLLFVTLFFTGSRSAILALGISSLFWIIVTFKKVQNFFTQKKNTYFFALAFAFIGCLSLFFPREWHRLTSLQQKNTTSFSTRVDIWGAGIRMFVHRPVRGYGQDTIEKNIEPFLPESLRQNTDFYVDRLHSEPLDILVMDGLLSFVGYMGLIGCTFFAGFKIWKQSNKNSGDLLLLSLLSLLCIVLYTVVNFATITTNIFLYFLLGYIGSRIIYPQRNL